MNVPVECAPEVMPCPEREIIRVSNPATLDFVTDVPETDPKTVTDIVRNARSVQVLWSEIPTKNRIALIKRLRDTIKIHLEEIAFTIAQETGKPKIEAINSDIIAGIGVLDYALRELRTILKPRKLKLGRIGRVLTAVGRYSYIHPRPIGVVAIISPWNYPFGIPFSQVIMAVAAGNAVVVKPSSETPVSAMWIPRLFEESGFPRGLVQVIPGSGMSVGSALVESAVDRVIFTGSTDIGRQVMRQAAQRLTPVTLELGGKDPMVVFEDADLPRAIAAAAWGSFLNAGQTCVGVKRIYVQRRVYAAFLKQFKNRVQSLRQGWGWDDPDVSVGPMINTKALQDMEERVAKAVKQGAKILIGGKRNPHLSGLFFEPTIIVDAMPEMEVVRREIFGPIVVVMPFDTEEQAIQLANASDYALAGSVWTRNIPRGKRVAEQISSGTVVVNNLIYTYALGATPWGGKHLSGFGRTHGEFGFNDLLEPHHIHVDGGRLARDPWWSPYTKTKIAASLALMEIAFFGKLRRIFAFLKAIRRKK